LKVALCGEKFEGSHPESRPHRGHARLSIGGLFDIGSCIWSRSAYVAGAIKVYGAYD
jgi:hypothetical protein